MTLVSWGIWAVLAKAIPTEVLSAAQIQVVSTLGMLPILFALGLSKDRRTDGNRSAGIVLSLAAGLVSTIANIPYYTLLSSNKAAAVVPLTSMYPLVTVLLAFVFLRERLNYLQMLGVCLSILAIYFLNVRDEHGILSARILMALVPITMWGTAGLLQKMSTNQLTAAQSAYWFLIAYVLLGMVMAIFDPPSRDITMRVLLLAIAVGFTMALGNYTLLQAFAFNGKASIITPLTSLYPIISIPIAVLIWHEAITWREALGGACALLAVVLLSYETPAAPNNSLAAK